MNTPQIPDGFSLSSASFGLRDFQDTANGTYPGNKEKDDALLIYAEEKADVAAVFTQNIFAGAPVLLNKKNIQSSKGKVKAILVNTVFSNAGTGEEGIKRAEKIQKILVEQISQKEKLEARSSKLEKEEVKISPENILLASTGKIGPQLPVEKFEVGIPQIAEAFDNDVIRAGKAIMTTDLVEKIEYIELSPPDKGDLGGSDPDKKPPSLPPCQGGRILGLAKGSGMIAPNMATMLSFILTDVKVDPAKLQKKWKEICDKSFNQVSVDDCESTSDMAFVLTSQKYEANEDKFFTTLQEVAQNLAKKIAMDGEGATHLIEVTAKNWSDEKEAKQLARAVVTSDLFKAAVAGHDPNWGRICSAIGSTKIPFDPLKLDITIDGECVYQNGSPVDPQKITESRKNMFQHKEVIIEIDFHNGEESATAWGCDLTKEYVAINAEYST